MKTGRTACSRCVTKLEVGHWWRVWEELATLALGEMTGQNFFIFSNQYITVWGCFHLWSVSKGWVTCNDGALLGLEFSVGWTKCDVLYCTVRGIPRLSKDSELPYLKVSRSRTDSILIFRRARLTARVPKSQARVSNPSRYLHAKILLLVGLECDAYESLTDVRTL